jgi:AhpD family alkylhydroperoxidase
MKPRIKNPAISLPGAMDAMMALAKTIDDGGVPKATRELLNLRVSQINGCSVCVDIHTRALKKLREKEERVALVAAWRDSPYFSDKERAALALAEASTRLLDRADPVPDEIWNEAAQHYGEQALASLVMSIAMINFWNRLNIPTRQVGGEWTAQYA